MDNKKIGSFIAERRKAIEMTQLELANRLNITDRAVSKWENGRGLPDISLIQPLCNELKITVNELLSGEKISEKEIGAKSEENIINTLELSKKKQRSYKKIIITVIIITLLPITVFSSLFCIDLNRMQNRKPVFFGTWGFDYYPPIDLSPEKLEATAERHLTNTLSKKYDDEKYFVAAHVYLIEEIQIDEFNKQYVLYAWVRGESRRMSTDGILEKINSFSIPYKFTLERIPFDLNGRYTVVEALFPEGVTEEYQNNMKRIFPKNILKEMETVHNGETIPLLNFEINEQIKLYYDLDY